MIQPHLKTLRLIFTVIIIFFAPGESISQKQNQPPAGPVNSAIGAEAPGGVSLDDLKILRAATENAGDLTEDVKKVVLSYLDRAIFLRETEAQLRKETEDINQMVKAAPERIKAIEAKLDQPHPQPEDVIAVADQMKPEQLEQHLNKVEAELSDVTTGLNKLADQLTGLKDQPAKLQQEIANADKRLLEIATELQAVPAADEPQPVTKARKVALLAEQSRIETGIKTLEHRLANHETMTALISADRDLAAREVARQEILVKIWQAEVQRNRELEAKKERVVAEQAKNIAVDLPPVIQKEFDVNIQLGKMLEKVTGEEAQILENLERKQAQLKQIEEEFAMAREQVKYPMHTETIGLALREQRRTLPSIEIFHRDSNRRQMQMGEIRSIQMDLDRQRRELVDLEQATDRILADEPDFSKTDIELLKTELRRLLTDRRDFLKKLQAGFQRTFKSIQRLEFIEQQVAAKAQEEALFLDEHLLWIKSAKSISLQDLRNLPAALTWIINPLNWWQVFQNLLTLTMNNPFFWFAGLLVPLISIVLRRWAHRDLSRVAVSVYSVKTDTFILTLRALALTARVAFGWPFLMMFTGWQLVQLPTVADFARVVGNGLIFAAPTLAGCQLIYELCWKQGVAKVHFKWPESVRRTLQRNLRWFTPLLVTMSFFIAAVQTQNEAIYTDSLGRLALIVLMLGFLVWAAHVLRISGEIVSMLIRRQPKGWLVRLRFIWYPLAMGVPFMLAVLAGMGYYYSALALYVRLGETIALILGLVLLKDLVLRWFFITQRRLTYDELKRKKEAEAEKQEKAVLPGHAEGEAVVIEEPEINLDQIYDKNRQLLRTIIFFSAAVGLWVVWSTVLPALNFLENVELWNYSSEVDGVRQLSPITLSNLMVAIMVTIVTVVAAKNLPGLLEIILLNWFPMDAGSRHAFSTIFNYAITALGIVIAFTTIGFQWSSIQWLVAALGVGLGFGLQEVVANFICGLIVLFERPFRIGDTVTIADISGTVTRIQIRATTILDWDRKELIVPNKEFITGRLINWTLSDKVIRIKIPIGIAYGSDTEMAEKILLEAAKSNPLALENPRPQAIFKGFGDNSLNFEVRVFINDINNWIPLLHKLNQKIDREFRKAGVTISFPQRDVHLDQAGPLEVRVVPNIPAAR